MLSFVVGELFKKVVFHAAHTDTGRLFDGRGELPESCP
jgi:hypothetical protein